MKFEEKNKVSPTYESTFLKPLKLAIIQSRFNLELTERLTKGAIEAFCHLGGAANQIDLFYVPGAFEIPLAAKKAALTQKYDAILCFGVVIKGQTYHFESVANAATMGIAQVTLETKIPLIHGVLMTYSQEQAKERLFLGKEYLYAALDMIQTLQEIESEKEANLFQTL